MRSLLLILLLSLAAWARPIVGGQAAGDVKLDEPFEQVLKALGRPASTKPSQSDPQSHLVFYQGLALLVNGENKVIAITVTAPDYKTAEGVGVGSPQALVQKQYGAGIARGPNNMTFPARGLAFSFGAQGLVDRVVVFKPEKDDTPLLGDRQVVGGDRAGQIKLGSPAQAVVQAWGAPDERKEVGGGHQLWNFKSKGVRLMVSGSAVDAILVTSGDYMTREGVKVGDNQGRIVAQYGPKFTRKGPGLFYPEKGIGFLLGNDSVIEIQVLYKP